MKAYLSEQRKQKESKAFIVERRHDLHVCQSMRIGVVLFALILMVTPAAAYVSDGHEYDLACTAGGYVLTSKYPITRTTGYGAGTQYVKGREKLYLGRSCDAFAKLQGKGSWCWANGGFFVQFADHRFEFWRQELYCTPDDFDLRCRC